MMQQAQLRPVFLFLAILAAAPVGAQNFGLEGVRNAPGQVSEDGARPIQVGGRAPIVPTSPGAGMGPYDESTKPDVQSLDFGYRLGERVRFDVVDGVHWAVGQDYKASADVLGFSFMPFLGGDAPKTYEFNMQLESASLGGEPLELQGATEVQRSGNRWILDRGPVEVLYDFSTGAVEQSFALDVAGVDAELALHLDVVCELELQKKGDGFLYANEHGGVVYRHTVVVDGAGRRLELPIQANQQGLSLVVPASYMRDSVAPVVVDPIIFTFTPNAGYAFDLRHPDVAYDLDTDSFAFVHESKWSATDHDLWMETRSASTGALLALEAIEITTSNTRSATVASDNTSDQFLVVYREEDPNGLWGIWGRLVDATDTSRLGGSFLMGDTSGQPGTSPGWDNGFFDVGGKSQGASLFKVVWDREFFGIGDRISLRSRTVTPAVPFAVGGLPVVGPLEATTNVPGFEDTRVTISESSGMSTVAEWSIAYIRENKATGAQSVYTIRFADDNTPASGPFQLFNVQSTWFAVTVDVSEGLSTMNGPLSSSPTYVVVAHLDGPNDDDIWLHAVQDGVQYAEAHLSELEHQDLSVMSLVPSISTLRDRFVISYTEFEFGPNAFDSFSTTVDLTNTHEFAVVERRVKFANHPFGYDNIGPGSASKYSGGDYLSRYAGVAVSEYDGTNWAQVAAVMFPFQPRSAGHQYCDGFPNTTGDFGFVRISGATNPVSPKTLSASAMPLNQFGYFLVGHGGFGTVVPPGSTGRMCILGGDFGRYNQGSEVQFTGTSGAFGLTINPTQIRGSSGNVAGSSGQTYNFQVWYREDGGNSNFTNAVSLTLD